MGKLIELFTNKVEYDGAISYVPSIWGYITLALIVLALLFSISLINSKNSERVKKHLFNTKQLVFCSVAIALAVITSTYLPKYDMPMGGSVTLFSMFFISFIGYLYGIKIGIISGIAYGFLQLILGPYILSIPQLLIDYPLAFGALGLSGLFSKSKNGLIKGYVASIIGRYIFSFISGWIFFGIYGVEYNLKPIPYSLVYNAAYIGVEAVITIILLIIPAVKSGISQIKKAAI